MAGENVRTNIKARVDAIKVIPDNAMEGVGVALDRLFELKPVQAIAEGAQHLGKGILQFIDKQAEITRKWAGEIKA